jgi:hypothetical protein
MAGSHAWPPTLRPVAADPPDLGRRRHRRHEDLRLDAERARREGHRGAVIAARSRRHAGRRDVAQQQVGEGAARFERAGMLQLLQLEDEAGARDAEVGAVDRDDRM